MKQAGRTIIMMFIPLIAAGQSPQGPNPAAESMSYRQARRALMTAMQYAGASQYGLTIHYHPVVPSSIRLTHDTLEFDGRNQKSDIAHFTIPLQEIGKLRASCKGLWMCSVEQAGKKTFLADFGNEKKTFFLMFGYDLAPKVKTCGMAQNHDECMKAADQFVAALNSLHTYALGPVAAEEDFHQQAMAWRALVSKPALPEAARVRRLMAEDALKNHKPEEALRYYEQGLDLCPMWPEGWFNAALVAGELGRYADAAEDMQNYLELVPNAKDAQAARDQMEMWKLKAGQSTAPAHSAGQPNK
jgi:tetratricopeptide (TPR) repeat protein